MFVGLDISVHIGLQATIRTCEHAKHHVQKGSKLSSRTYMHRWKPLREGVAESTRATISVVLAAGAWLARRLDYAHPFRSQSHYE